MRNYLAGKMSGEPLWGFQRFEDAFWHLSRARPEWEIVSPHNIDIDTGRVLVTTRPKGGHDPHRVFTSVELSDKFNWQETLVYDFKIILDCDGIIMLPGWEASDGAVRECIVALLADKQVFDYANGACEPWTDGDKQACLRDLAYAMVGIGDYAVY